MARWIDHLVEFSQAQLSERELENLWVRGVTDDQIRDFRIGCLRGTLPALTKADDFLEWSRRGAKLRDVYVFPLTNALGQIKGLQFRHVDRARKGYSDYFLSKDEPVFFGLGQAMPHIWESERVILVEGNYDLFPIQRVFPDTVATLTSSVTTSFHRFLRRNVREVWLAYDMDSAGRHGAKEFVSKYGSDFERVRVGQLPRVKFVDGRLAKDPSDLWEAVGDDRFGLCIKSAFGLR